MDSLAAGNSLRLVVADGTSQVIESIIYNPVTGAVQRFSLLYFDLELLLETRAISLHRRYVFLRFFAFLYVCGGCSCQNAIT